MQIETDCDDCKDYSAKVVGRTAKFIIKTIRKMSTHKGTEHTRPPHLMIMIMTAVGTGLEQAIKVETAIIMTDDDLSDEEKMAECQSMLEFCVKSCFKIVESALPIDMVIAKEVQPDDADKVTKFIDDLRADKTVTH